MDWIEKTLEKAEKNGEKVMILSHFPTNSRFVTRGIFWIWERKN